MTLRQVYAGMLQLLAVFAFFGAAVFLVALPFVPELRFAIAELLLQKPDFFAVGGIILFGVALLMTMGFLGIQRGRYLLLQMGGTFATTVDRNILCQTIGSLLRKQFAARIALNNIEVIRGKKLEIGLFLTAKDPKEREQLLLEVEKQLQTILAERFGYRAPFTVQAVEHS